MKFPSMVNQRPNSSQLMEDSTTLAPRPQALSFGNAEDMVDETLPPAAPKLGPNADLGEINMEEIMYLP